MSKIFYTLGGITVFGTGLWGLFLSIAIVSKALGTIGVIIGIFLFPVLIGFAPWYALLANGDWLPLIVCYGGMIPGGILMLIGSKLEK